MTRRPTTSSPTSGATPTTIPGRFPKTDGAGVERYDHRLYYSATRDFVSWTPAALFYEPGFGVIDARIVRVGARWYLYLDRYREHRCGALASDDLRTWTDVTARLVVLAGMRHGTALAIPAADARRLLGGR